jgi:chitodextrinase
VVLAIDNSSSAKFIVRLKPVVNARAYEAQYKNGAGWLPAGVFTDSRRIEIGNLTPGTSYLVQVRAVGGSTGYSDWSAPQPCIAT